MMKKVAISLAHIIFLFLLFPNNLPATDEKRLALVIGNSNYTSGGTLRNPINDVRSVKEALEALGFLVMKYENCTQRQIKEAIDVFGIKLKGQDVGLFFYAGHGLQVKGRNYLVPTNAKLENENDAEYDCVRADRVLAKMEAAGSRTNIVILDACRDNPFERSWRRGAEGTGLAFMNAPSGSLIAYSTAPGKTALDGIGTNSIYTSALLQHIYTPNISVLQMFQRVRSTVMDMSNNEQIPWESTSLRGDFCFSYEKGIASKLDNVKQTADRFDCLKGKRDRLILLSQEGNFSEVMKIINKAIKVDPKKAEAYVYRGLTYKWMGQPSKAIKNYDKAIELDPECYLAYSNRASYYADHNQPVKALKDYNKVMELYPEFPLAYLDRGMFYTSHNQPVKAIKDLDKALKLKPDLLLAYYHRGVAYAELGEHVKAIKDYDKANHLDPTFVATYIHRGISYASHGQSIKAIKDFDKAIELNPKHAGAYARRGNVYAGLKRYTEATQDLTKAIELDPKLAWAYASRANVYYDHKQPIKAIKDYDTAIELNYKYAWVYRRRGAIYLESLNRKEQGCSDIRKACDLGDCEGLNIAKEMGYCR